MQKEIIILLRKKKLRNEPLYSEITSIKTPQINGITTIAQVAHIFCFPNSALCFWAIAKPQESSNILDASIAK